MRRPELMRRLPSIAHLAEEQKLVRIWGGIHFRTSLEVSDTLGREIVKQLVASTYQPVR